MPDSRSAPEQPQAGARQANREQHALGLDAARPEAIAKRHSTGRRSARENISALCEPDSFIEYGGLAIAAQRSRRPAQDLQRDTPGDGMVCGVGRVRGQRCVILSYDYTVLAGTQGFQNHRKTDRMIQLARRQRLPVVFFTEGGGGRPGDVDINLIAASGLEVNSFHAFAGLSGQVPLIAINTGRCFAGNAAFAGCCDVVIASQDSQLGMGGPAMIEGGGLGRFSADQIGPSAVQSGNGVIDILVADDAAAVRAAQDYLSYFGPTPAAFSAPPEQALHQVLPDNRLYSYDAHRVLEGLADSGSVLELRPAFGPSLITALVRVEGRSLGALASNPKHLAGAIDAAAADKAARFMQLCDAHGLPLLSLCDTPGIMVGPDAEKAATVRHASRLFVVGAAVQVPWYGIITRKAYGLGAQALLGGHLKRPEFTVAWPSGELGPMGLEGAVRLGFKRELEQIEDPAQRAAREQQMIELMYQQGRANNVATYFEIDDVIDPADSRRWLADALQAAPLPRTAGSGRFIDPW